MWLIQYFNPSVQLAGVQYEYNKKQTVYGISTIRNILYILTRYGKTTIKLFNLYCTVFWSQQLDWREIMLDTKSPLKKVVQFYFRLITCTVLVDDVNKIKGECYVNKQLRHPNSTCPIESCLLATYPRKTCFGDIRIFI